MNLADNLKKIRKDNNLSQEQLAEKLNVSRQAVSKWESGLSYPEMDKVLQICQIFNLNINELINEDVKEVREAKEATLRNNKYIASFFDYITKTIDMFSSMKFKQKIKCLFEQGIIAFILFIIGLFIGAIFKELLWSILQLLPEVVYYPVYNLLKTLYLIVALVVGSIILLHIFKTRYLDYYEIVKDETKEDNNDIVEEVITEVEAKKEEDKLTKKNKIFLEKKKERIVIRDPKHSEYKFFNGIGKFLLWCVKLFACFVLTCFALTLIAFVVCIPISFLVFSNIILFIGLIFGIIGGILLNVVILELIYNFIVSRKINKSRIFITGIVSLVLVGFGVGFLCVSATEFDVEKKQFDTVESKFKFKMNDNLVMDYWGYYDSEITYIEKDIKDIEIVVEHSDMYFAEMWSEANVIDLYVYSDDSKIFKYMRSIIDGIKRSSISAYDSQVEIYVYGSKNNLDILKNNTKKYDSTIKRLEEELNDARESYNVATGETNRLREMIINSDVYIEYDDYGNIIGIKSRKEIE